jgi:oligopeptidase B
METAAQDVLDDRHGSATDVTTNQIEPSPFAETCVSLDRLPPSETSMRAVTVLFFATAAAAISAQTVPTAPVAAKKPHELASTWGDVRDDPYYWLRDDSRKDPEMLAYLKAENAYADAVLAHTRPLQDKLYAEFTGRIKQDDESVPYLDNGYFYYTRFETGADYPVVARKRGSTTAREEILLDEPRMAAGNDFFVISDWEASPDNRLFAWAQDTVGRRQYVLKVKDLSTGRMLPDTVSNIEPNLVWANDSRTIFYVDKDPVTLLSTRIKAHVLGTPANADKLVYEEKDTSFYIGVQKTSDDEFICIAEHATTMNEQRCTSADRPGAFAVISPRESDHLYEADHVGGRWLVKTNWQAPNYRIMSVADADMPRGKSAWVDVVKTSADVLIDGWQGFDDHIALQEWADANLRIRLIGAAGEQSLVQSDEPAYSMNLDTNKEPGSAWLRYTYTSLVTPTKTFEVNVKTGERKLRKSLPTPGYDPSRYETVRVWATARDGTKIPVSLVYEKGFKRDGTRPLFQYAYGSYGISTEAAYAATIPSLLDRGFVYAIAHVRGGQELGRKWFDDGHLQSKKNSFTDFVDVTRWLVANKYAAKDKVAAEGRSAGGLLMGAVANMAPQDYKAIVAQVPFVDIVTTMSDPSIPLTTNEYDEWGNPTASKATYDYMLSYSPYDNVQARPYPAMFVGTGLWDSQVQYYEPAKWVAKLRETTTGKLPLVFRVNMEAGHGGKSGRFTRFHESAEQMAFVIAELGVE